MLDLAEPTDRTRTALRAWELLSDGNGAWQWAGLEAVAALLDCDDLPAPIDDLTTIRANLPSLSPSGQSGSGTD